MPTLEGSVSTTGDDFDVGYAITLPASIAADELIVVEVESNRTAKCDATGEGFTELVAAQDTTDSRWIQLFAKVAAGGETTFDVDWNAAHFGGVAATAHRISDWSGDLDDLEVSSVANATGSVACGAVTESGLVLRILGGKSCTYTPPSGVTLDENPAALSTANVELAVYTDDDNSTGSESFTVTSRQQAFTLVVPSGAPPLETIDAVTVADSLSVVAGAVTAGSVTIAAVTVADSLSIVAGAVTATGTAAVALRRVTGNLSAVAGAVTPASAAAVAAVTVADALEVVAGAVTAGTATIAAATVTATASVVAGDVGELAFIAAATVTATASPVAGAVTPASAATIAATTVADALEVVAGAVTAGTATIAATTVADALSIEAGAVTAGPVALAAVTVTATGTTVAGAVTAAGTVTISGPVVADALEITAGAVTPASAALIADVAVTDSLSIIAGALISIEHLGPAVVTVSGAVIAGELLARVAVDASYWTIVDASPRWQVDAAEVRYTVDDAAARWAARPEVPA